MTSFKKTLLSCTALLTITIAGGSEAYAQAAIAQGTSGTWAANGTAFDDGTIEEAATGATLDITGDGVDITVVNDGTADDTGGFGPPGLFTIGGITDSSTANDGDLIVTTGAGGSTGLAILTGTTLDGNVTILNVDGDNASVSVTADSMTVGGNLVITNAETDITNTVDLGVATALTVSGTTTITGGDVAGAFALLEIGGTSTLTGGVTLDDGAGGDAQIAFSGGALQTLTASINGASVGEGSVIIANNAGVNLNTAIGAGTAIGDLTLLSGGDATLNAALNATTINIGAGSVLIAATNINSAVNFTGAGALALEDGINLTGNVTTTTSGAGTITSAANGANTSIVSGTIGASNALGGVALLDSGTFQFNNTVNANTISADAIGGTLDFNGNVTGNVNLAATGTTADFAAGGLNVTGNIDNTTGGDGAGTLTLGTGAGFSITGNVGATNSLATINLSDTGTDAFGGTVNADDIDFSAGTAVTFANDVTSANGIDFNNNAGTITFADNADLAGNITSTGGVNGTINFSGTSNVTGGIGLTAGTGFSALNINGAGGTVTLGANSFGTTLATALNSILDMNADLTLTGAVTNNGTIDVAAGSTFTANGGFAGNGTYNIEVRDADSSSTLNAGDVGLLTSTGAIDLSNETTNFYFTGTTQAGSIDFATGGAPAVVPGSVTESSAMYDVAVAVSAGNANNLELTITQANTLTEVATPGNNQNVATVLSQPPLSTSTNPEMQQFQTDLANGTTTEVNNLLKSVTPETNNTTRTQITDTTTLVQNITGSRIAQRRRQARSSQTIRIDAPASSTSVDLGLFIEGEQTKKPAYLEQNNAGKRTNGGSSSKETSAQPQEPNINISADSSTSVELGLSMEGEPIKKPAYLKKTSAQEGPVHTQNNEDNSVNVELSLEGEQTNTPAYLKKKNVGSDNSQSSENKNDKIAITSTLSTGNSQNTLSKEVEKLQTALKQAEEDQKPKTTCVAYRRGSCTQSVTTTPTAEQVTTAKKKAETLKSQIEALKKKLENPDSRKSTEVAVKIKKGQMDEAEEKLQELNGKRRCRRECRNDKADLKKKIEALNKDISTMDKALRSAIPTKASKASMPHKSDSSNTGQQITGTLEHTRTLIRSLNNNGTSNPSTVTPTVTTVAPAQDTGVSNGDDYLEPLGVSMWGQVFGSHSNQGYRKGSEGSNANTVGIVIGADTFSLIEDVLVGVTFSYADAHSKSKSVNASKSFTDTYLVSLYGSKDLNEKTAVSGSVSYGFNQIESHRYNVGGVVGQTASADYNAHQVAANVSVSQSYEYNGLFLSPGASASWSKYMSDSYTETGAGGLNLSSSSEDADSFALGAGIGVSKQFDLENGAVLSPSFNIGYSYDLIGDEIQSSSQFAAGGPVFTGTGTKPAQGTLSTSISMSYTASDHWEFSGGYGYTDKDEFGAHNGFVRMKYKF